MTQTEIPTTEAVRDGPVCIESEEHAIELGLREPAPESKRSAIWRASKRLARYTGYTALAASATFAVQNHDVTFQALPGVFADGDMKIPDVEGCDPYVPPVVEVPDTPPTTEDPSPDDPTPTTEPTPPTTDAEDISANKTNSAARKNDIWALSPKNLWDAHQEYRGYFDNMFASHTSEISGIEYQFYLVGGEQPPILNLEAFEEMEYAAFQEDITYFTPQKQHAIDCMRTALFGDEDTPGRFEGRVMPVVIPAEPACVQNFRIRYDNVCAQSGYKMPRMDVDFLFWDLNPKFDEFIVLTTGGGRNPDRVDPELTRHEIWHMQQEWVEGDDYRLSMEPEERMAKSIDLRVESEGVLDCILPPVFYGSKDEYAKIIADNIGCETDWTIED